MPHRPKRLKNLFFKWNKFFFPLCHSFPPSLPCLCAYRHMCLHVLCIILQQCRKLFSEEKKWLNFGQFLIRSTDWFAAAHPVHHSKPRLVGQCRLVPSLQKVVWAKQRSGWQYWSGPALQWGNKLASDLCSLECSSLLQLLFSEQLGKTFLPLMLGPPEEHLAGQDPRLCPEGHL